MMSTIITRAYHILVEKIQTEVNTSLCQPSPWSSPLLESKDVLALHSVVDQKQTWP